MKRNLLISLPLLALLPGCLAQSQIQAQYMDQQDTCRTEATRRLAATPVADSAQGQAVAGAYFSECMNQAGWRVSMPRTAAQTQPAGSASAPVVTPAPQQPATTPPQQATVYPPSGAPSVNPSAAAARVNPPVQQAAPQSQNSADQPAQYLPRTQAAPAQPGYGPGRQF